MGSKEYFPLFVYLGISYLLSHYVYTFLYFYEYLHTLERCVFNARAQMSSSF